MKYFFLFICTCRLSFPSHLFCTIKLLKIEIVKIYVSIVGIHEFFVGLLFNSEGNSTRWV